MEVNVIIKFKEKPSLDQQKQMLELLEDFKDNANCYYKSKTEINIKL